MRTEKLPPFEREFRFASPRRWRFDFCWPERKVAVEIEGLTPDSGRHQRVRGGAAIGLDGLPCARTVDHEGQAENLAGRGGRDAKRIAGLTSGALSPIAKNYEAALRLGWTVYRVPGWKSSGF